MISVLLLCWQDLESGWGYELIQLFKVPMIRDRKAVDGSAFDDFSRFFYVGKNRETSWGYELIGLFKPQLIRDLAEETVDGSAFDDFSASSMLGSGWGYD